MSTPPPPVPVINYGQDEIPHLRSQNEQLWKIIEKQRVMIQNLQKDNVRLSAERDGLLDQVQLLEKEVSRKQRVTSLLISPQTLNNMEAEDTPSTEQPFSFIPQTLAPQPMPPPRSPYRPLKAEKSTQDLEEDIEGRSSPGSPAPTAKQRKDSAPLPSPSTRNQSPFLVPSPSKSSSSLEINRKTQQRASMMPPARAALDHDPTMRAASPPVVTPVFNRSNTSNSNRITMFSSSSRTDVSSIDEPTDEIRSPDLLASNNIMMANVSIKVVGSNIKPNDKGKEVISFILSVGNEDDQGVFEERWRVEKLYSDFLSLDSKMKAQRNGRAVASRMGKLPDKALFSNNAPSKVDQRKIALEQYLQHIVALPLEDASDLCEFLSTNVVDTKNYQQSGQKEGYLTKRGKNFGGWKTRYFVLNENVLEYYESKEGTQLGSIRLTNAQIGRQMQNNSPAMEEYNNVYRHAFLIVEQKRVGSTHFVRHILCASSDDDRDEWVQALLQNIQIEEDVASKKKSKKARDDAERPRKLSKGEIKTISATPISHLTMDHVTNADMEKLTNVPNMEESGIGMAISESISSDANNDVSSSIPLHTWSYDVRTSLDQQQSNRLQTPRPQIVRRSSMGNLISGNEAPQPTRRAISPTISSSTVTIEEPSIVIDSAEKKARNKAHRMTFWGKKMLFNNTEEGVSPPKPAQSSSATTSSSSNTTEAMTRSTTATSTTSSSGGLRGFLSRTSHEQNDRGKKNTKQEEEIPNAKQVFGVSLEEAVRISRVKEGYELPAVVYRCIEYLDAMDAVLEEGLYRLSGSNSTMKALKERFNQEGDVNLLTNKDEYDIHVVAGLLKLWLRELPTSVLTREHRMDFLHVIDLLDRKDRVNELGRLVSVLPLSNYTLLRALTAHLIRVVQHSDINKMTMRNVSIVFSPTLGIPATIFNLFMSEFEYIFWTTKDGDAAPRMIEDEVVQVAVQEAPDSDFASQTSSIESITPVPQVIEGLSRKTTLRLREEHGRSNRNSVNYMDGAPNAIVDLEKNLDGPPVLDEDEDEDVDEITLSNSSTFYAT